MRLEPVFLVAPPKQTTTRRAFLLAGAAGVVGCAAGFGGGYWVGSGNGSPRRTSTDSNPRIEWAKSLAGSGDDDALLADLPAFLGVVHEANQLGVDDPVLWDGVLRAATGVIAEPQLDRRRVKARALLTVLALRPEAAELDDLRRQLELASRR